jgi:hypothetical protein
MKKAIIEPSIQDWLGTLGYKVSGQPPELIVQWFYREARQWEMTPGELETFIKETNEACESPPHSLPAWTCLASV